jgi:hypothetical protein
LATTANTSQDIGVALPAGFERPVKPTEVVDVSSTRTAFSAAAVVHNGTNFGIRSPETFSARPWVMTFYYIKTTDS